MTTDKLRCARACSRPDRGGRIPCDWRPPRWLYLHVEIGDGWVDTSLFQDEGNRVVYHWGSEELPELVTDAWCLEPADKRWTAMHYTIDVGKFDAMFEFDDLEGSEESIDERRERILRARYGDKPVVYPPLPAGGWELTPPK